MRQPRIALVGNLANVAYQTCKFLRRKGVLADVFVGAYDIAQDGSPDLHDPGVLANPPDWLRIIDFQPNILKGYWAKFIMRKFYNMRFLKELRHYDLIESFVCQPFWIRYVKRPYISFATGSDLRELAVENSKQGHRARQIFQNAEIVFFGPDPGHINCVRKFRLKSSYPYRQIVDTDFFHPSDIEGKHKNSEELLIFHPTRQDWAYQGTERWTKGNDKLFKAFAQLVKEGYLARLIYLDRGEDREKTAQLVDKLNIQPYVESMPGMTRAELFHYYNLADVVADQFSAGGFGLITLEAMACGRPVLVDVDCQTIELCYEEFPSLLNCRTEEEIYYQLKLALNLSCRKEIGHKAREWIMRYHHWEKVINKLIWHYETILGGKVTL